MPDKLTEDGKRCRPGHSHRASGAAGCRLLQQRRQQLREQPGSQHVGAHLQLVALGRLAAVGRHHDAGVVCRLTERERISSSFIGNCSNARDRKRKLDEMNAGGCLHLIVYCLSHMSAKKVVMQGLTRQDIQPLLPTQEILRAPLHGRQVREIDLQELQPAVGLRMSGSDLFNGRFGLLRRAAGNVDGAVALVEDLAQLFTAAGLVVSIVSDCISVPLSLLRAVLQESSNEEVQEMNC